MPVSSLQGSRKNAIFVGNEGTTERTVFSLFHSLSQSLAGFARSLTEGVVQGILNYNGGNSGVEFVTEWRICIRRVAKKMTNCCKEGYPSMGYPSFDSLADE